LASSRKQVMIRGWSKRLLRMLKVEARIHGLPDGGLPGNLLIVANHVSWLDIFVLNTLQPSRFIAKSELRRWPIVGRLIRDVGTLFIERDQAAAYAQHQARRRGGIGTRRRDCDFSGRHDQRRLHGAAFS
jgi:1-acyl-sn-glycerol-3-phosphate acyltransferase